MMNTKLTAMKTTAENRESFNEILFTGRNKEYGAYEIRSKYEKYLMLAFFITSSLFMVGISVPLIASYYGTHHKRNIEERIIAEVSRIQPPPPVTPPPPPPANNDKLEKQTRLLKPIISIDTANTGDLPDQGSLNDKKGNDPVTTLTFTHDSIRKPVIFEEPQKKEPWLLVEEPPEFIGGEEARLKFLADNIIYPPVAKELGITGTVYIEYVVEDNGEIGRIKIIKGIGGGCEEEAFRVVKMMKYKAGRQSGIAVPVKFTIPIKFLLRY